MDEFGLIARWFRPLGGTREDIELGIGDDGAVVRPGAGKRLVIAVDTLVEGQHFPAQLAPDAIAFRAAAVNLSDLAAMGATPRYATLALTLPGINDAWLERFARGLRDALAPADCALVGGDTTRGPLTVTIQVIGELEGDALTRAGARAGDLVAVSGTLGDSRGALDLLLANGGTVAQGPLVQRFERPSARLALSAAIRSRVHAAIDISDGLLADLGHVAAASDVDIDVEQPALPMSDALVDHCESRGEAPWVYAATGGDDYELAVTLAPEQADAVVGAASALGESLTLIGRVVARRSDAPRVRCLDASGAEIDVEYRGYRHFT